MSCRFLRGLLGILIAWFIHDVFQRSVRFARD
jgi:hypothetical protein